MQLMARVIDKILFAGLFIAALQVPILADHYRQYLSGYYDATKEQVIELENLARQFNFSSVDALIESLRNNADGVVQQDAENKAALQAKLEEADNGLKTLSTGNYFEQARYMFAPARKDTLFRVLDNFAPSIPLTPAAIVFSLIVAIALNILVVSPLWAGRRVYHWRQARKARVRFS